MAGAMEEEIASEEPELNLFENKIGLADDMKFLASMPELCDVTFMVGDKYTTEPVCAVKAILSSRSRVFLRTLYHSPSPQRKREPVQKENKLRMFLKRSSEPLLNLQIPSQQPPDHQHHTLFIDEFEPDVFRQLTEYIHTGYVTLQPRTLLGLMNAADHYALEELRRACLDFAHACINVDTVCALLASAEKYIQYKCTKSLVQKVLEFIDEHGNEILNLGSFTLLPQHVVRLVLGREELKADEFTKFQSALMWGKKYCDANPSTSLQDVIVSFVDNIQFHKIPASVLMKEVHPLGLVPYSVVMNALAFQADPKNFNPSALSPNGVKALEQGAIQSWQPRFSTLPRTCFPPSFSKSFIPPSFLLVPLPLIPTSPDSLLTGSQLTFVNLSPALPGRYPGPIFYRPRWIPLLRVSRKSHPDCPNATKPALLLFLPYPSRLSFASMTPPIFLFASPDPLKHFG